MKVRNNRIGSRRVVFGSVLLLALLAGLPGWAAGAESSAESLYERASALYTQGLYQEAIAIYEALLEVAPNNPHLLYNLGNAYYKDGQLGRAIVKYEQASRLLPRDEDILFNLRLARNHTRDKIDTPPQPLLQALSRAQRVLTIEEHTILALALYYAVTFVLLVRIAAPSRTGPRIVSKLFFPLIALLMVFGLSLAGRLYADRAVKEGIVTTHEAAVRSGPGQDFTEVFVVHEGTKARLRNARGQWLQISLPNGLNGWVPSEDMERL